MPSPRLLAFALILGMTAGSARAQVSLTATGGTSPATYANLRLAFAAINAGTHQGDIVLSITANITDNTTAILQASHAGAPYTSILIRPSGGVTRTVTGNIAGNALIRLNGASGITIDGLNNGSDALVLQNSSQSSNGGTCVIRMENGTSGNLITNATLRSAGTMGVPDFGGTVAFDVGQNNNHTISNCDFGPAGNNLPTKHIHSAGTPGSPNENIRLLNNRFFDYFRGSDNSAGLSFTVGNRNWTIDGNRFYQSAARTIGGNFMHNAIKVNNGGTGGAEGFVITNNIIGFSNQFEVGSYTMTGAGKFCAIEFAGDSAGAVSTISNNRISGIALTGASSSGTLTASPFTAIRLNPGHANVDNNTIGAPAISGSLTFSTTNTNATHMYGIYSNAADTHDFSASNNTVAGLTLTVNSGTSINLVAGMRMATPGTPAFRATSNLIGTAAAPLFNNSNLNGSQAWGLVADCAAIFTGNTVQNLSAYGTGATTDTSVVGLYVNFPTRLHTLLQNTVFNLDNPNSIGTTAVAGILFRGGPGDSRVGRNVIYQLGLASTNGAARLSGISIIAGAGNTIVDRNFIHSFNEMQAGGVMSGILINGGVFGFYTNNMIRLGLTPSGASNVPGPSIRGFNHVSGGQDQFYHNSVYLGGSGVNDNALTAAFYTTDAVNSPTLANNIFVNARSNGAGTGSHYAIRINQTTGYASRNNIFQATGTGGVFGQIGPVNHASLGAWQGATGQDLQSLEADPRFRQPNGTAVTLDLHLSTTLPTPAEGSGFLIGGVTDDFDGQSRPALTPVDIGADAGIFIAPGTGNPVAGTLNVTSSQGFSLAVAKSAILAVCSDPNMLPLTVISVGLSSNQGGTVSLGANDAVYTPPSPQFTGADLFSYTVQNSGGMTASGTVNVTVQAPAFPPRATAVALGGGGASFTGTHTGVPGLSYAIEFSDSLPLGFQPLLNGQGQPVVVVADSQGSFTFVAQQSPIPPKRFYRARAQ